MIRGHGGNVHETAREIGVDPDTITDMSSNINPLGPPPPLLAHLQRRIRRIDALPEADAAEAVAAVSRWVGVDPRRLIPGNGTTQFLYALPAAMSPRRAVVLGPTYADYADACRLFQVPVRFVPARAKDDFLPDPAELSNRLAAGDLVFICNPNNPTGVFINPETISSLCREHADVRFIVDESYLPFLPSGDRNSLAGAVDRLPNLAVLLSFSKIFRIPGLRIGFMAAGDQFVACFSRLERPWAMNALAQEAVGFLMAEAESTNAFIHRTRRYLVDERKRILGDLSKMSGIRVLPSETPFHLVCLKAAITAEELGKTLVKKRILIRNCANFEGLTGQYFRFSLKSPDENDCLIHCLARCV